MRRGRPKPDDPKNYPVATVVNDELFGEIKRACRRRKMTRSVFVRMVLESWFEKPR